LTGRSKRAGIIGTGLLGSAIAEQLRAAGYSVTGYDIRPERIGGLRAAGVEAACCAAAVALASSRVILSLPTSAIAASVLEEIAGKLAPGSIVIDTTTGEPDDAIAFERKLLERGVKYMDATVGGSSAQVRSREAIFMCGGERSAYDDCADLFAACCQKAFYVGPAGSGARMKLVLNLVLGLNRAALAEGLEFARACGIDAALALEILKAGPAYSRAMDTKGQRMLNEDFEPEARLSQHLKDVRLILASGKKFGARLPLSQVHEQLLERAEAAGFGAADNSAIIKSFQNGTGE